jgi:D-ribose pyranose/furanose isomerase RbsD
MKKKKKKKKKKKMKKKKKIKRQIPLEILCYEIFTYFNQKQFFDTFTINKEIYNAMSGYNTNNICFVFRRHPSGKKQYVNKLKICYESIIYFYSQKNPTQEHIFNLFPNVKECIIQDKQHNPFATYFNQQTFDDYVLPIPSSVKRLHLTQYPAYGRLEQLVTAQTRLLKLKSLKVEGVNIDYCKQTKLEILSVKNTNIKNIVFLPQKTLKKLTCEIMDIFSLRPLMKCPKLRFLKLIYKNDGDLNQIYKNMEDIRLIRLDTLKIYMYNQPLRKTGFFIQNFTNVDHIEILIKKSKMGGFKNGISKKILWVRTTYSMEKMDFLIKQKYGDIIPYCTDEKKKKIFFSLKKSSPIKKKKAQKRGLPYNILCFKIDCVLDHYGCKKIHYF